MRRLFAIGIVCFSLALSMGAQDAVPNEILSRTWLIRNTATNKFGTGFVVDHKGTAFLVTARHMVEGLPTTKATIDIWQENTWKTVQTIKTLFPKSNQVDIAVFKLNEKISAPYQITSPQDGGGGTFGQQVWFLGYPYQIGSHIGGKQLWDGGFPFIKRGTMSAIDGRNPDAVVYFIDGFNNPGFSGGPVVYWDFKERTYRIMAVVKGYMPDTAKIAVNGQQVDTLYLVNSGILIAYSIKHADDAIEADDTQ